MRRPIRPFSPSWLLPSSTSSFPVRFSYRIQSLIGFRDDVMRCYHLETPSSMFSNWLHGESGFACIPSSPVRDVYDVYMLQCVWVLLSTLYAVRSADGDHRIMSFPLVSLALSPLKVALLLNPAFGRARFYRAGFALKSGSFLDAVYFFFSALDAEDAYFCREQLDAAFQLCQKQERILSQQRREKGEFRDWLRLSVLRFLGLLGRIWTKIDVDGCDALLVEFEGELGQTLERISRGEIKGSSDVFVYMLSCLLICVDLCEGEDDAMHALREYRSKSESERPLLFVISNRDTRECFYPLSGRLPTHLPDHSSDVRTDRGFDGRIGPSIESLRSPSSHDQSVCSLHVVALGIPSLDERSFDADRSSRFR